MYNLTEAVKHLLIINGLVYLGVNTFLDTEQALSYFALFYPESPLFKPWQIITHMFMHGSVSHLMFNMLSLFFIGPLMENVLGTRRFVLFYFTSGLGGALLHFAFQYYQFHFTGLESVLSVPAVGASGAINGLFIGLAYLFPDLEMYLMFIPVPIKARYLAIGLLAYDLAVRHQRNGHRCRALRPPGRSAVRIPATDPLDPKKTLTCSLNCYGT